MLGDIPQSGIMVGYLGQSIKAAKALVVGKEIQACNLGLTQEPHLPGEQISKRFFFSPHTGKSSAATLLKPR